ncbi:hypothetical protein D7294_30580 [Streptomyces hoynatensis]|uniref:PD-(D/E)XK endonuclease-like domain-containing protein n=2 Tax=Streptomyces hoynatensis TaxID=1141874 RepID=A0A3A9YG70_9ACTN|nr:hypothetical protein D7294_30580 [Streptomyces hoynatensis]
MCGKSYQLGRVQGFQGPPAWWSIGGNAVHATMESWDHNQLIEAEAGTLGHMVATWGEARTLGNTVATWGPETGFSSALEAEIRKAKKVQPDQSKWRVKRRSSEGETWWRANGPAMVQSYIDWRLRSPSWEIWITPDGEPAIELDVSGYLPGCDAEIKAYLDRVFEDKTFGGLIIVDAKSGSSLAKEDQLGTYRALLMQKYGVAADRGATFRTRTTDKKAAGLYAHPATLEKWSPEYTGALFGQMDRARKAGIFIPKLDSHCDFFCDARSACYAVGGPEAAKWDPDHPAHVSHP